MGYLHGQVGIFIKEVMKMTPETVMGKCIGQMVVIIKENGRWNSAWKR